MINANDRISRTRLSVVGHGLSVAQAGKGPGVIFIHGNATYSYGWRNIIPYVAQRYRCLAIDLPGMGMSDVVSPSGSNSYAFEDQATHLETAVELLESYNPVVLVGHELGATMAIQYTRKNPDRVAGLALVEGVFRVANDDTFDRDVRHFLTDVRGERGEELVLKENTIVEKYLPRLTSRTLGPTEMEAYRQPYVRPGESRRAMLSMIRQLPVRSTPGPIDELVEQTRLWCAQSRVPKLVVGGSPGFLVPNSVLGTTARWAETTTVSIRGSHYLMEDSPARLTSLILDWLFQIGHTS
ncbi:haloalkane dehalogenase [soil metagenome]